MVKHPIRAVIILLLITGSNNETPLPIDLKQYDWLCGTYLEAIKPPKGGYIDCAHHNSGEEVTIKI